MEADPKSCDDCELAANLKASKDEEKKAAEMEQYAKSAEAELEKESSRASEAQKRASDAATKTKMKLQKAAQRARRQQAKLNQDKTKIEGLKRRTALIEERKTEALNREQQTAQASAEADATQEQSKLAEKKKESEATTADWQLKKEEKMYDDKQKRLEVRKEAAGDAKADLEEVMKSQQHLRAEFKAHSDGLHSAIAATTEAKRAAHVAGTAAHRADKRMKEQLIALATGEHRLSGAESKASSLSAAAADAQQRMDDLDGQANGLTGEMSGLKKGLSSIQLLAKLEAHRSADLSKMSAKERQLHVSRLITLQMLNISEWFVAGASTAQDGDRTLSCPPGREARKAGAHD